MERQLHFVRHGEVENPRGILYGRLPGYHLSERGQEMAKLAADEIARSDRPVSMLYASPLLRARQSAAPIAEALNLEVVNEPRIIEPTNSFEGSAMRGPNSALKNPKNWLKLWNPLLPSWGEPNARIYRRVLAALDDAWEAAELASEREEREVGDIIMVAHQAPIWIARLGIVGKWLAHNPDKRRCELSSITSFTKRNGEWREVGYRTPAAALLDDAKDVGAV